jgi:NAD(P)-dependent dehydrogenase (short-subunit alcohol dehydrogenase family)
MNIKNKIIILSGSEGLIGNSLKKYLIKNEAKLICLDIKKKTKKNNFDYHSCNLLNENDLIKIKNKIIKKYKKIDALINLACLNDPVENPKKMISFKNLNSEIFKNQVEKNIMMTFLPCKVFGSEMQKQKKGSIINFSSTYGIVAPDQNIYKINGKNFFIKDAAYPTAKFAIIGLTKYLASYWSEKNIRVNVVAPGGVENNQNKFFIKNYTNKTLSKRMARTNDFNGTVHLLISDLSDYITGATISVDGGWTTI